jgi:hypothetical protein
MHMFSFVITFAYEVTNEIAKEWYTIIRLPTDYTVRANIVLISPI